MATVARALVLLWNESARVVDPVFETEQRIAEDAAGEEVDAERAGRAADPAVHAVLGVEGADRLQLADHAGAGQRAHGRFTAA